MIFTSNSVSPSVTKSILADEMHKLLDKNPMLLATYVPVQGDYELRVEIANYLNEHQKLVTDPSHCNYKRSTTKGIDLISPNIIKTWRYCISRKSVLQCRA